MATDPLTPDPGARIAGMVAERFADRDAARMAELDRLIRAGFGSTDPTHIPADEIGSPASAAPSPMQETNMACPECKSKTIHKATCSRRPGGPNGRPPRTACKVAARPALTVTDRRKVRRGSVGSGVLAEVHELQQRARARLNEIDGEIRGLKEAIDELASEAGQLRDFLGEVPGRAPRTAQAVG